MDEILKNLARLNADTFDEAEGIYALYSIQLPLINARRIIARQFYLTDLHHT